MKSNFSISFLLILIISAITFTACNTSSDGDNRPSNEDVTPNATLVVDVEGMSCAKGCAPAIESAFAKRKGVANCSVSYDDKLATIEYDNSKISEEELLQVFPKIGSGTYSAKKRL